MRSFKAIGLIAVVAACADKPYDPGSSEIDPNAPRVHITTPARGTFAGDVQTLMVSGTATDDSGKVASVKVNGVSAQVGADGAFSAYVPVTAGTNLLQAVATDGQGNVGKESRAVVAGPTVTVARKIPDSITATVSAQTLDAVGRGAAGFIANGDLLSLASGMNPVVDAGDGPDCLYAQAAITSMDVGDAEILMTPVYGGIQFSAELTNVSVGLHLQWSVACFDGSRDVVVRASTVRVSGTLVVGIAGRDFDIKLEDQDATINGFQVQMGGIPDQIIDMLHLETAMGPILAFATERFVVPMLNKSLAGLNEVKTVDVLGAQVNIDVEPSRIDFTPEGGMVILNTSLRAKGDSGNFVYVENTIPAMDMSMGFQLAVADDAANQLLASMWSAKAMDKTFDLKTGSYGAVGQLFDSVQLEVKVPPFVDASGDKLVLTVGDMMASFKLGGSVTTQVAINAQVELEVVAGTDGKLRLDVGTPTTYVDVLDEAIEGSNQLSNAEFEAIVSFAMSRIVAVGSGSVGAIPLPSFGGVAVTNLSVEEAYGYLIVGGQIQ